VPPGKSDRASVWPLPAGLMSMLKPAEALVPEASATCAVKEDVPGAVGVPVMAPVVPEICKPAGKEPAMRLKS